MTGVVDLVFSLAGETIAADYALPLWRALRRSAPWLEDEPDAAVLPIAGAGESSGAGVLYLGRRARLALRLPQARLAEAEALSGRELDLGEPVTLGTARRRALSPSPTQYSPFVAFACASEQEFIDRCGEHLARLGIAVSPICGRARSKQGECGEIRGFSLMLHGLTAEDSLTLQATGLGEARKLGCGTFIRHKSAAAVGAV